MKRLSVPLLALGVLALWACADAGAPERLVAPRAAFSSGGVPGRMKRVAGSLPADMPREASEVIGPSGGHLAAAGYEILVPGGAVRDATLFTLRAVDDGTLSVQLTATRRDRDGTLLDVGPLGFRKKVTLVMSYAGLAEQVDPAALAVVWVHADGVLVRLPSSYVDPSRRIVAAQLEHFSGYAVAVPDRSSTTDSY